MERAKARRAIGVIASVLVLGGIGWAAGTGTISGTVRDKDTGEPLPGASVIVEGTKLGAIADREGRYTVEDVPVGIYSVTVRMVGYSQLTEAGVEVRAGRKTVLDFELSPRIIRLKEIVVTATKLEERVEDLEISIGNKPHFYIYTVKNPMEGAIAKRRSYATLVDHMIPVMTPSGLYDELEELEDLLRQYEDARNTGEEARAKVLEEEISKLAEKVHLRAKPSWTLSSPCSGSTGRSPR